MRSKQVSFRIPWRWWEWVETRAQTMRPRPYKNEGAYFLGLSFFDCMVQRPHLLTVDLANAGIDEQDRIIEELRAIYFDEPMNGSWLDHQISDAIAAVAERHGLKLQIDEVKELLTHRLRDRLTAP